MMVNIWRVNVVDLKECMVKESEKDYLYIIFDNIIFGLFLKVFDYKIFNIMLLGLKKECYMISSLVYLFIFIGFDYFFILL